MRKSQLLIIGILLLFAACSSPDKQSADVTKTSSATAFKKDSTEKRVLSQEFKEYWYDGLAEISNYNLSIERYGEVREGNAVLIFVTEPFDPTDQIKADQQSDSNISVLKLNATMDFNTGIYPYKIMSSTFLPLEREENAIKVATSIQEWCGHTYMQLNLRNNQYDGVLYSYFQSEGNTQFKLKNAILENQIAMQLRLDPSKMPVGSISIIPSTEHLRLNHIEPKALPAIASSEIIDDYLKYTIDYKSGRSLSYRVQKKFPFQILSWEEYQTSENTQPTIKATLKKSIRTPYWKKNSNKFASLRDSLAL